jgi:hypothetical protein
MMADWHEQMVKALQLNAKGTGATIASLRLSLRSTPHSSREVRSQEQPKPLTPLWLLSRSTAHPEPTPPPRATNQKALSASVYPPLAALSATGGFTLYTIPVSLRAY